MTVSSPAIISPTLPEQQTYYTKDDIIRIANGTFFADSNAPKLPKGNMLMVDRITDVQDDGGAYDKGFITAELDIHPDLWFFDCHFANDPVMPGCLGLDALWQLIGFHLARRGHTGRGRALGVGEVKFTGQVLPSSRLVTYKVDIKRLISRKLVVAVADAALLVDGREIYHAKDLKVGVFQSTDNF